MPRVGRCDVPIALRRMDDQRQPQMIEYSAKRTESYDSRG
jgi:hypothetical protein